MNKIKSIISTSSYYYFWKEKRERNDRGKEKRDNEKEKVGDKNMLKPEFVKALDLVKLGIILQAINQVGSEYITSSDIAELTELFSTRGILSAADVRRVLNKFNIKAESNREGYRTKVLKTTIIKILDEHDFLDFTV